MEKFQNLNFLKLILILFKEIITTTSTKTQENSTKELLQCLFILQKIEDVKKNYKKNYPPIKANQILKIFIVKYIKD